MIERVDSAKFGGVLYVRSSASFVTILIHLVNNRLHLTRDLSEDAVMLFSVAGRVENAAAVYPIIGLKLPWATR